MSEVRLIDANALKEDLAKEIKTNDMGLWLKILLVIDNAPTVEMPQGRWIAQGKEYVECDNCSTWFKKRYLPYGNFCCKCGAKMTEGIRYENIACNSGS